MKKLLLVLGVAVLMVGCTKKPADMENVDTETGVVATGAADEMVIDTTDTTDTVETGVVVDAVEATGAVEMTGDVAAAN